MLDKDTFAPHSGGLAELASNTAFCWPEGQTGTPVSQYLCVLFLSSVSVVLPTISKKGPKQQSLANDPPARRGFDVMASTGKLQTTTCFEQFDTDG